MSSRTFLVINLGVMSVTNSFCRSVVWFQGMLGLIMFTFMDILLIFRGMFPKSLV